MLLMYNLEEDKDKYFRLGKLIKTFGYRGEVIVSIDADEPGTYGDMNMFFVDIDSSLVPWFIENIEIKGERAQVKLEDVDQPEAAVRLLGRDVYLPLSKLRKLEEDHFFFHEVAGFRVIDKVHGDIGRVAEILDRPGQDIIRIILGNKDILVPLADEMISGIDKKNQILYLSTPPGLIDLYLE